MLNSHLLFFLWKAFRISLLVWTRYPYLFSFMEDNLDNKALFSSRTVNAFLILCTYSYLILGSRRLHLGQASSSALSYHLISLTKGQRRTWIFELEKTMSHLYLIHSSSQSRYFLLSFQILSFIRLQLLLWSPQTKERVFGFLPFPLQMSQEGSLKVCTCFCSLVFKLYIPLWEGKPHLNFSNSFLCLVSTSHSQT